MTQSNDKIKQLVIQAKTDISGKWINIRDLESYTQTVLQTAVSKISDPVQAEKVRQEFNL